MLCFLCLCEADLHATFGITSVMSEESMAPLMVQDTQDMQEQHQGSTPPPKQWRVHLEARIGHSYQGWTLTPNVWNCRLELHARVHMRGVWCRLVRLRLAICLLGLSQCVHKWGFVQSRGP